MLLSIILLAIYGKQFVNKFPFPNIITLTTFLVHKIYLSHLEEENLERFVRFTLFFNNFNEKPPPPPGKFLYPFMLPSPLH